MDTSRPGTTSLKDLTVLLSKISAIITNSHVVYTSGKHGSAYVNKDAIYPHTEVTSQLCLEIAKHFEKAKINVVVAPAIGGVILSQWVAYHLTKLNSREVLGVYAEKNERGDGFVLRRGYDKLCQGKRVLVVEDILTTGGSVKKVIELVKGIPAEVVGVAALCNRGGVTAEDIGNPPDFFPLTQVNLESWDERDCPLCRAENPINLEVGKGREFLAKIHKSSHS